MSVLSPKRVIQFVVASLLALPLLANHPSPRLQAKMAFDEQAKVGVLFGGRGLDDPATGLVHANDETWVWIRDQWIQQFPATRPAARSAHAMTYDSQRGRVLLFGGRIESAELRARFAVANDTWAWKNGEWQQIATGAAPPARYYADMTYDRARDRVVLFGGYHYAADGKTLETLHDTWEFDGATWTEVQAPAAGPTVDKPLLAYNIARNETTLVGLNNELATVTYRWDPAGKSWQSVAGETKPPCANEASLSYQTHNQRLVFTGGVCGTSTALTDEVWEFDGAAWTKIGGTLNGFGMTRTGGSAYAYDTALNRLVRYGGTSNFNTFIESMTAVYNDGRWQVLVAPTRPNPRSLTTFRRDPVRGTIWLYGGLSEFSYGTTIDYTSDFWRYDADGWHSVKYTTGPGACVTPASAFDTDRQVLVLLCGGGEVWEWNGDDWKSFNPKPTPEFRRFAGLVYDASIKKTVMFGGYDNINYRDETWTWDGTVWTKLKPNKKPNHRAQMAMWYDPLAKKTFVYSGVGRPNLDERVTRFADMWSFDGTTWTEVTKTADPGIRFGAQIAIDPRDGKVLMFGGLRATIDDKDNVNQFYGNDTWKWDGSAQKWTQLQVGSVPPARQNGAMEWDATHGRFVLYGGFAGNLYFSDTWLFDGSTWTPVLEVPRDFRRRGVRQ